MARLPLFQKPHKPVIGMLHLPALPGSPHNRLPLHAITDHALRDADALSAGGIDALMLENFGDTPFYPGQVPPHTIAFMTAIATAIRARFDLPLGVNVLRNDASAALSVAAAAGAQFIRVNVFTGARLTDQGIIAGAAHELLRFRKMLNSDVQIFADVDVKHSAPLAPRDLRDEVEETLLRASADAVIITGSATGKATPLDDLATAVAAAGGAPVLAGSGAEPANLAAILAIADGVIAGTALKHNRITTNPVDPALVRAFLQIARSV